MRRSTIASTIGLAVLSTGVVAMPKFMTDFKSTYGIKPNSKIAKAGCALCHVGNGPKLNAYGLQLQTAMKEEKTKILTGSVMKKVEGLSAANDGVKNVDKIHADQLPAEKKK